MTSYCFNHLAIWYDGDEAYRNVKSATTESDAAEIECSNAPAHKIGTRFFKQNPNLNEISPPQKLVPDGTHNNTNSFHKFLALESLSGEKMDESLIQVVNNIRQEVHLCIRTCKLFRILLVCKPHVHLMLNKL